MHQTLYVVTTDPTFCLGRKVTRQSEKTLKKLENSYAVYEIPSICIHYYAIRLNMANVLI